jgi:hypothetical protein
MLLNLKSIGLIILSLIVFKTSFSQDMSSDEKKRLKQQLKSYIKEPERFKKEQEALMSQMAEQRDKLKEAQDSKDKIQEILSTKDEQITNLEASLSETKEKLSRASTTQISSTPSNPCADGQFKVQIGKFDKFSINSYLEGGKCIKYENQGSQNVYTIEGFAESKDAFNMAQELRRMGLTGAFVTKFVNNQRVAYDHVGETGEREYYSTKNKGGKAPKAAQVAKYVPPSPPPGPTYINTGYQARPSTGSVNPEIEKLKNEINNNPNMPTEEIIEEAPASEEPTKPKNEDEDNFKEEGTEEATPE